MLQQGTNYKTSESLVIQLWTFPSWATIPSFTTSCATLKDAPICWGGGGQDLVVCVCVVTLEWRTQKPEERNAGTSDLSQSLLKLTYFTEALFNKQHYSRVYYTLPIHHSSVILPFWTEKGIGQRRIEYGMQMLLHQQLWGQSGALWASVK